MKRILAAVATVVFVIEIAAVASAQLGWFAYKNFMFIGTPCTTYAPLPPPVNGALCSDTANGQLYTWRTASAHFVDRPTITPTATATATATPTKTATPTATAT